MSKFVKQISEFDDKLNLCHIKGIIGLYIHNTALNVGRLKTQIRLKTKTKIENSISITPPTPELYHPIRGCPFQIFSDTLESACTLYMKL